MKSFSSLVSALRNKPSSTQSSCSIKMSSETKPNQVVATTTPQLHHDNSNISSNDDSLVQTRLQRALWCFFAGDALASPTHWYYGGAAQIRRDYGSAGITDYTQPVWQLPGSILNKSNVNGGGRRASSSSCQNQKQHATTSTTSIVGQVILHGKQDLWSPHQQIHYHATLHAGETTLEATLGRVLLQSLTATGGRFDAKHFCTAYMQFMRRPGSHNDTYASTCHRMFFANLVHQGLPPEQCPDNDGHNVLTVDGLVWPTIASLVTAAAGGTVDEAATAAANCAAVTRRSDVLERTAAAWGAFCARALLRPNNNCNNNINTDDDDKNHLETNVRQLARQVGLPVPRPRNTLTACYLDSALPAILDNLLLFQRQPVWDALLVNANTGGENVHRGACLGAALGVYDAASTSIPDHLQTGLYHYQEIDAEIKALMAVIFPPNAKRH